MENRIKECQLDMFAGRTSTATMRANQLRLWFASAKSGSGCGVSVTHLETVSVSPASHLKNE